VDTLEERLLCHLVDNKRATDHAINLRKTKTMPEGLKIKIKPHGVYIDTPRFKEEWNSTIENFPDLLKDC